MIFFHNSVLTRKIHNEIFFNSAKINLSRCIENNIFYNFKIVSVINFIKKKHVIFEKN